MQEIQVGSATINSSELAVTEAFNLHFTNISGNLARKIPAKDIEPEY